MLVSSSAAPTERAASTDRERNAEIVGGSPLRRRWRLPGRSTGRDRRPARSAARSRLAALGGWVIILVAAAALAGPFLIGSVVRAASPAPSQTTGNDVAAGAALFQQSCATCHGAQGQGVKNANGSQVGPNIQNMGAAAADFVLRTGRMPLADPGQPMVRSKPAFTPDQIRQLVAYVASLGNGPAIPSVDVTGADLSRGRALFTANCAACHAPTGARDAVGGGVNAPALGQATALDVAEAMRIGPPPMPVFGANSFSQQDVNDIAAYVEYLRNNPSPGGLAIGEIGPVPEGFVAFVVGLTIVLLIIRFVGRRGRTQQRAEISGAEE